MINKYISEKEATRSITAARLGIDNTPDAKALERMQYVAAQFDKIREHFNKTIGIASFYRCPALNKAVGGSPSSFHKIGAAIDIDADIFKGLTNRDIFKFIYQNLEWSELIYEFPDPELKDAEWIHYALVKGSKTKQVKVTFGGGKYRFLTKEEIEKIFSY